MIGIEAVGGSVGLLLGCIVGWYLAHRRLPRTLAEMSKEELSALARAASSYKTFLEEPVPTLDERNRAALAAVRDAQISRGRAGL